MVFYFRVKNRMMNKKETNYSIFGVNLFSFYYRVKNRISLKYFLL